MSDLSGRRARVTGSEADPDRDRTTVRAEVPEVELLSLPGVLRSVTHGTGSFARRPLGYEPAPPPRSPPCPPRLAGPEARRDARERRRVGRRRRLASGTRVQRCRGAGGAVTSSNGPSAGRRHRPRSSAGRPPAGWSTARSCPTGSGRCPTPCRCCGCSASRCSCGCCSARTPTAGRSSSSRCPGVTDWADGKLARLAGPGQPARRAARPGRRPPLHRRHAGRARAARRSSRCGWSLLLVGRELVLGLHAAGAAPLRLPAAAGPLPGQGGHASCCSTPSRACCSPTAPAPLAARRRADRVGAHHLGHRPVPAGRAVLRRPGRRASSAPSGPGSRAAGTPDAAVTAARPGRRAALAWAPPCSTRSSPRPSTRPTPQAAEARAARERRPRPRSAARPRRAGAAGSRPGAGRRSSWPSPACWPAVTYDAGGRRRPGPGAGPRGALIGDIDRESAQSATASPPSSTRCAARSTAPATRRCAATGVGQAALDQLAARRAGGRGRAGHRPRAAGHAGRRRRPKADADPVGGPTATDPRGQVRDGDLQLVVNALWAAGAEAISINGQRLGPPARSGSPARRCWSTSSRSTNPYQVSAIGEPGHPVPALPRQTRRSRRWPWSPSPSACASTSPRRTSCPCPPRAPPSCTPPRPLTAARRRPPTTSPGG